MNSKSNDDNKSKEAEKVTQQQKPKVVVTTKPKPSIPENVSIRLGVDLTGKTDKSDKK